MMHGGAKRVYSRMNQPQKERNVQTDAKVAIDVYGISCNKAETIYMDAREHFSLLRMIPHLKRKRRHCHYKRRETSIFSRYGIKTARRTKSQKHKRVLW